uniref:NADH dehydrogenase subunit 6 n=1 Tax=Lygaeus sp. FS-2019 TaxID=2575686 RepID=A0A4D6X0G9_9HEMI|nr:NADH dehydrogenase subunit 6 [Lygaeus sp. FS-2019]
MNIIMSMIIALSTMFMMVSHPLSMVIIIIMQTMFISLMTGMMIKSFWFSYIILIIMMSGMLVLFIYMASIASNEKFKFSIKLTITMMLTPITLLFYNMNYYSTTNLSDLMMLLQNLFNFPSMLLTIMLTIYLLFTMITVSKIVNIHEGPLRIKK